MAPYPRPFTPRHPLPACSLTCLPPLLQLLAAPLAQERIAALVAALDVSTLAVLPQGGALVAALGAEQRGSKQACRMALSFLQACCVAVPLLLIAAADEPAREEQDGEQPGEPANTRPARLMALGDAAAAGATAAALRLRQQTLTERAALLWMVSTLIWLLINIAAA